MPKEWGRDDAHVDAVAWRAILKGMANLRMHHHWWLSWAIVTSGMGCSYSAILLLRLVNLPAMNSPSHPQ